jgi:hypothetical protein
MLLLLTVTATACRLAFLLCSHNCPPAIESKLPTYLFAHLNSLSSLIEHLLSSKDCIPEPHSRAVHPKTDIFLMQLGLLWVTTSVYVTRGKLKIRFFYEIIVFWRTCSGITVVITFVKFWKQQVCNCTDL